MQISVPKYLFGKIFERGVEASRGTLYPFQWHFVQVNIAVKVAVFSFDFVWVSIQLLLLPPSPNSWKRHLVSSPPENVTYVPVLNPGCFCFDNPNWWRCKYLKVLLQLFLCFLSFDLYKFLDSSMVSMIGLVILCYNSEILWYNSGLQWLQLPDLAELLF